MVTLKETAITGSSSLQENWLDYRRTSGIGRPTAVAFAEQGAKRIAAARRGTEGAESVRLIQKAGVNDLFVRTDVAIEEEVATMVAR